MALFCTAIWRDSVSLLKFSFFSQVQFFLCEMSIIIIIIIILLFSEFFTQALADGFSLEFECEQVSLNL